MKYLSAKRYLIKEVEWLLMVLILGIVANIDTSYASQSETATSDVNAAVEALTAPMVKTTFKNDSGTITSTAGIQILSIQVTPPLSQGVIMLSASGTACIYNHIWGPRQAVKLRLSRTKGDIGGDFGQESGTAVFWIAGSHPSHSFSSDTSCVPFYVTRLFDVTSTNAITLYLNTAVHSSNYTYPIGRFYGVRLIAQYFPSRLP